MSEVQTKQLAPTMTLREFLRTAGRLSAEEKMLIARQALVLLEQNYAHLPLKLARYAVNPLQRLRLLLARLSHAGPADAEWRFHAEMLDIFGSLRDLHTRYTLPEPFAGAAAFLPFRIKEFTEDGARHFIIAPRNDGSSGPLPANAEVISWNGVPIERAVDVFGDRLPGANPAARRARALEHFTVRSLGFAGPPDEEFVLIQYLDLGGTHQETRQTWQVALPRPVARAGEPPFRWVPELELDVEAARVAWLKTVLFAPNVVDLINTGASQVAVPGAIPVAREMATSFVARLVPGIEPELGHIRIKNFSPPVVDERTDTVGFVNEFIRLLGQMPSTGVIIDIRGNPGGSPVAAELCLQALTARVVESQPLQFITSSLNLSICRNSPVEGMEDLRPWLPSLEQAVESGAVYSAGVPRTPADHLRTVPQAYIGPVVLLTDARVYSAADRFAAGFQDNRVGVILGVDANTGAGGGNIWHHNDLVKALTGVADSPYRTLPAGTDVSVAIRRTLRVGRNTGAPVEDFGVVPDAAHQTTRDDILKQGVDLMAHAARLIERRGRRFEVELDESVDGLVASFEVENIDRADIYTDGRPRGSASLADGLRSTVVSGTGIAQEVRIEGFEGDMTHGPVAVRIFRRDHHGRLVRLSTFG